jgi:hypothetical protein
MIKMRERIEYKCGTRKVAIKEVKIKEYECGRRKL